MEKTLKEQCYSPSSVVRLFHSNRDMYLLPVVPKWKLAFLDSWHDGSPHVWKVTEMGSVPLREALPQPCC